MHSGQRVQQLCFLVYEFLVEGLSDLFERVLHFVYANQLLELVAVLEFSLDDLSDLFVLQHLPHVLGQLHLLRQLLGLDLLLKLRLGPVDQLLGLAGLSGDDFRDVAEVLFALLKYLDDLLVDLSSLGLLLDALLADFHANILKYLIFNFFLNFSTPRRLLLYGLLYFCFQGCLQLNNLL